MRAIVISVNYVFGFIVAALFLFLLSGCAPGAQHNYTTPQQVSSATVIENDPYTKSTWFHTPMIDMAMPTPKDKSEINVKHKRYEIRGVVKDKTISFAQLYVIVDSSQWLFLDRAFDIEGKQLKTTQIDRKVITGKWLRETIGVTLPTEYLAGKAQVGLNIKLIGSHGSAMVEVPNTIVMGYMDKVGNFLIDSGYVTQGQVAESQKAREAVDPRLKEKLSGRGRIGIVFQNRVVTQIAPQSPAEASGLQVGDVMLSASGMPLTGDAIQDAMLLTGPPETSLELLVMRGAQKLSMNIIRGPAQ